MRKRFVCAMLAILWILASASRSAPQFPVTAATRSMEPVQYYEAPLNPREVEVGIGVFCEFELSAEMIRTNPRRALMDEVMYIVERYHVPEAIAEEMTSLAFQDFARGQLNMLECRSALLADNGAPLY